jgi:hypothetical protein
MLNGVVNNQPAQSFRGILSDVREEMEARKRALEKRARWCAEVLKHVYCCGGISIFWSDLYDAWHLPEPSLMLCLLTFGNVKLSQRGTIKQEVETWCARAGIKMLQTSEYMFTFIRN